MATAPIVRLQGADLGQLETLLCASHLPAQDCAQQAQHFHGIFDAGRLVAAGGLEPAGSFALLRSVVVHAQYRRQGLGYRICEYLIETAEAQGREAIYLLTETAAVYFQGLGFVPASREQVPGPVSQTRQFISLCPDSASCLVMQLRSN